jgi:hypothetical protein
MHSIFNMKPTGIEKNIESNWAILGRKNIQMWEKLLASEKSS